MDFLDTHMIEPDDEEYYDDYEYNETASAESEPEYTENATDAEE